MGTAFILAGLAFFIVPSIGILDFMPDLIGCALILKGLSKQTWLNADAERAYGRFRYLFFTAALKTALVYPLAKIGDETTTMLFVFSFAVAETVFFLPAAGSLVEGFTHLCFRFGGNVPQKSHNDMKLVFPIFVIASRILVVLPELTVLTKLEYQDQIDVDELQNSTLYESKNLITLICAAISLFIGVVFYITAVKYFSAAVKNKDVKKNFNAEYASVTSSYPLRVICKNMKSAALLLSAGAAFGATLYFYGLDVLFDAAGFALAAAGFAFMSKYAVKAKTGVKISLAAAAFALIPAVFSFYVAEYHFHKNYDLTVGDVRAYTALAVLQTVCYIAFAVLSVYIYGSVKQIVNDHVKSPTFDEEGYKRGLLVKYKAACVAGCALCPVMSALAFLYMYNGEAWIIGGVLMGAYAIYLGKTLMSLPDEIERTL